MDNVSLECVRELYNRYEMLVLLSGIPDCDYWSFDEFHDLLDDFMYKYESVFNMIHGLGFDWIPCSMDSFLHYYGLNDKYYINLMVFIEGTRVKSSTGLFDTASISFKIDTNDDSLRDLCCLEVSDSEVSEYEDEEEDEEEDDKPWLR